MFGLTYISQDDKIMLEQLQKRLSANRHDDFTRNEAQIEINRITESAKPYTECNLEESLDLKRQILGKINILQRMGKAASINTFLMHLKDLEFHMETLKLKSAIIKAQEPPRDNGGIMSILDAKKKKERVAYGHTRYTSNFYDEEDDE